MSFVDEFALETNITSELKSKLKAALRYSTDVEGFSWKNKKGIFEELPMKIRYEVTLVMHKQAADRIRFFNDKDQFFITAVIPLLTPAHLNSHEYIYYKDDVPEEIYFIAKGRVSFVHDKKNITFVTFLEGSMFGDVEVLMESKRKFHAMSTSPASLLALNYEGINVIKNEFKAVWKEMERISKFKDSLLCIAVDQALKICKMKGNLELANESHDEIKDIYYNMIFDELGHQNMSVNEDHEENPAEKFVGKLAEYGNEIKAINLKASVIWEKVRIIEKFLI